MESSASQPFYAARGFEEPPPSLSWHAASGRVLSGPAAARVHGTGFPCSGAQATGFINVGAEFASRGGQIADDRHFYAEQNARRVGHATKLPVASHEPLAATRRTLGLSPSG
jgi:hypothetical protein